MANRKPRPGPRRVEAWIYGVINPLAEALEREVALGGLMRPTYRWRLGGLERVLTLRGYLSRGGVLILEDLLRYSPQLAAYEKAHDRAVREVETRSGALFRALKEDEVFQEVARRNFSQYTDRPDEVVHDLAEEAVNAEAESIDARPGTWRAAWNASRANIMEQRSELGGVELEQALARLEVGAEKGVRLLDALRLQLVERFDVPPAPLGQ